MGWFQRLFSGADGHDAEYRGTRSPDQARVSAEDLAGELRALHNEIKLLRESIGSGGRTIADGDGTARRSRRGGRNRSGGRDRERERDGSERGRDRDRSSGGREQRVGFDGERASGGRDNRPQRRSLPKTPPDDAPVGLLVDYLKSRGVVTFEGQDDLNRNEAFEHLARHLGMHFHLLANFYEKVKRCVATGRGQRIDIDGYTHAERSAAVQFGTLLHRHGMLKDFYYHRSPKKQLRVIPTKDGQVGQFLTGGWLEIYVSAVLTRRLRAAMSSAKFQLLYNVKGVLPDGREFEADLMAAVEGRLFWLECKTGQWQDYSARFRGLVKIFGVERESAALLLIKSPDANTRARATDMLDMTLLSLEEVDDFISVFLGEPIAPKAETSDAVERRAISPELGNVPPLTDDEIPLEDAEPAKKLGVVNLNGDGAPAAEGEEAAPRRRRRRRRGGRNRGGRSSSAAAGEGEAAEGATEGANAPEEGKADGAQAPAKKRSLLEPLPIERFDDEDSDQQTAAAETSEAKAAEGEATETAETSEASTEKPRRSRRRRRPTPFAAEGGEGEGEKAEAPAESDSAQAEAADGESTKQAEAGAEPVEGGAELAEGERPKRKRSRRRRSSAKPKEATAGEGEGEAAEAADASEGAQAEATEATEAVAEDSAAPVAEESTPEVKAEAAEAVEEEAEIEPAAEEEVVAEVEPEVVPEPEPEPEPDIVPVKSAKGVTIAPDLAAMMAGSKKPDSES
jgi:hypothetical protein